MDKLNLERSWDFKKGDARSRRFSVQCALITRGLLWCDTTSLGQEGKEDSCRVQPLLILGKRHKKFWENTTKNGGSQPGKILIPHQQEEETQSLSISWLFHTPGDINAPPGRERNPSISHLSINPPWCRCAGLWWHLQLSWHPENRNPPLPVLGESTSSPKMTSASPRSNHQHLYVLTIWILSHS